MQIYVCVSAVAQLHYQSLLSEESLPRFLMQSMDLKAAITSSLLRVRSSLSVEVDLVVALEPDNEVDTNPLGRVEKSKIL